MTWHSGSVQWDDSYDLPDSETCCHYHNGSTCDEPVDPAYELPGDVPLCPECISEVTGMAPVCATCGGSGLVYPHPSALVLVHCPSCNRVAL